MLMMVREKGPPQARRRKMHLEFDTLTFARTHATIIFRLILIFLSATLAGFFVLRNLRSQPQLTDQLDQNNEHTSETETLDSAKPTLNAPSKSKVKVALESGFWTKVDMASGRFLWRLLIQSPSKQ
ncbi:unnamed protein product [Trifolium pratense]|uniref:Uncharacterized protein n=1 Tax=Trifolium pratense TaxID=57577 RepID=A0ACB0K938_TRIPR|nr:unnamed protein product [Trifolium pratense]